MLCACWGSGGRGGVFYTFITLTTTIPLTSPLGFVLTDFACYNFNSINFSILTLRDVSFHFLFALLMKYFFIFSFSLFLKLARNHGGLSFTRKMFPNRMHKNCPQFHSSIDISCMLLWNFIAFRFYSPHLCSYYPVIPCQPADAFTIGFGCGANHQ